MSLKAFHVFFISVSALLALGVGYWGLRQGQTALGAGSLAAALGLIVYGRAFLRSKKNLGWL